MPANNNTMPLDTNISLEADVHHHNEDLNKVKSTLGDLVEKHIGLFPDPNRNIKHTKPVIAIHLIDAIAALTAIGEISDAIS